MGGLGRVWRVCNFMTQTQSDLLLKKKIVTQPNPPSLKNRPNPVGWVGLGWVGSGQVWRVGGFSTHPYIIQMLKKPKMLW